MRRHFGENNQTINDNVNTFAQIMIDNCMTDAIADNTDIMQGCVWLEPNPVQDIYKLNYIN